MELWQLRQRQSLPLEVKIEMSKLRIRQWYERHDGDVYVSFSGGKDSTVLLHLVRSMYPDVPAVFVDTGLEYPEIREFVKTVDNVIWLKPKMRFDEVIKKYGYPVISKEQALYIHEIRNTNSSKLKLKRINGINGSYKVSKKWLFLVNSDFKISHKCCTIMKKTPLLDFEKTENKKMYTGEISEESKIRQQQYLHNGCNAFQLNRPKSTPLGFWVENDILAYIYIYNVSYSKIYGEIIYEHEKYSLSGLDRTGCMFCMFGVHLHEQPNKFQTMQKSHPKQYNYCINGGEIVDGIWKPNKQGLGCWRVLDTIGVPYKFYDGKYISQKTTYGEQIKLA